MIGCDYWYLEFITALSEEDTEIGEKKEGSGRDISFFSFHSLSQANAVSPRVSLTGGAGDV